MKLSKQTYSEFSLRRDAFAESSCNLTVKLVLPNVQVFKFLEILKVSEQTANAFFIIDAVVFKSETSQFWKSGHFFRDLDDCFFC